MQKPTAFYALTIGALVVIGVLNFSPVLGISSSVNTILTLLAGLIFIVAHGAATMGWRGIIAFLVVTVAVSFTAEALGVATGLVFGPYHYTDLLGPKILGVPPMIQIGYAGMGYASMMMGRIIVGWRGAGGWPMVIAAFAGAMIMVSWDVAMDPYQSTVTGDWIWHTGGPYFGIPLHNYAGWFGTVFAFMLVYYAFASRYPEKPWTALAGSKALASLPALYYGLNAIGIIVVPFVGGVALPYASPGNWNGPLPVLEGSLALVATFVMGSPVVFTLGRLFAGHTGARPLDE